MSSPVVSGPRLRSLLTPEVIAFNLSVEDATAAFDGRCALSGRRITLDIDASLDRIDSQLGYEVGNVQWVHKDINHMKSDFEESYFVELCRMVARKHES